MILLGLQAIGSERLLGEAKSFISQGGVWQETALGSLETARTSLNRHCQAVPAPGPTGDTVPLTQEGASSSTIENGQELLTTGSYPRRGVGEP